MLHFPFAKTHNSSLAFSDSSVTTCSNIHPHNEIKIPSDGNIVGAKKPKAPRIGPDLLFVECTLLYSNNMTVERWKCGLDSNCEAYWRFSIEDCLHIHRTAFGITFYFDSTTFNGLYIVTSIGLFFRTTQRHL